MQNVECRMFWLSNQPSSKISELELRSTIHQLLNACVAQFVSITELTFNSH